MDDNKVLRFLRKVRDSIASVGDYPQPGAHKTKSFWKCQHCGKESRADYGICVSCGQRRPPSAPCPKCGRETEYDEIFCSGCGARLESHERIFENK